MNLRFLRFAAACAVLCFAIKCLAGLSLVQIDGTCTDDAGKPLANVTLKFSEAQTGRKFSVSTDAKGKFFYGAVEAGTYNISVERGSAKLIDFQNLAIPWSTQPLLLTLDLAKRSVAINRQTKQDESFGTSESPKGLAATLIGDDNKTVALREAIAKAESQGSRGDWLGAIATLKPVSDTTGQDRDAIWGLLGSAYYEAAMKSDDEETLLQQSVEAYKKAITLNAAGAYYNNLAQVYMRLDQWDDAISQFRTAVKASPENRALYEQNLGGALLEKVQTQPDEDTTDELNAAIQAFDDVLTLKPDNAEAYYLRAICQVRLLGLQHRLELYPQIEHGLKKYLELQPKGVHADEVRLLLESVTQAEERVTHTGSAEQP
jgi:tetratricopeptide (TPR) repeat protein